MGGGKQQQQDVITRTEAPGHLQPALKYGTEQALSAFQGGIPSIQADPLYQQARGVFGQTLGGGYNPAQELEAAYRRVAPGIQGAFARAGRSGSGAEQFNLAESFGNAAAPILGRERAMQQQFALAMPDLLRQIQTEPLANIGMFGDVLQRFNVGGQQSQPYFRNPWASGIGGGLMGAGIGGQLTKGALGPIVGGGLGLLGGLFG